MEARDVAIMIESKRREQREERIQSMLCPVETDENEWEMSLYWEHTPPSKPLDTQFRQQYNKHVQINGIPYDKERRYHFRLEKPSEGKKPPFRTHRKDKPGSSRGRGSGKRK